MNNSDIVAMWIVALALVGAVGVQGALPDMPPRPGYGVETLGPRAEFTEPGVAEPVVPPSERAEPALVMDEDRTPALAAALHGVAKRAFGC